MNPSDTTRLDTARDWLVSAQRVAVLTGAGISSESGVPTFRGPDGLWRRYRPEDLANPAAFRRDPALVWEWYDWRRSLVAKTEPNAGHYALVQLQQRCRYFTLITQNVDGLHDRAGSRGVHKLHGDLWQLRCIGCGKVSSNFEVPLPQLPPRCSCNSLLRPDIVWFGEPLPLATLQAAWNSARQADLFLVVGTSALVHPAASLPLVARDQGARVIEVNIEESALSTEVDLSLRGPASELLPRLIEGSAD